MQVSFYIDEAQGKELEALAVAAGTTRTGLIRDIINNWLELPDGFELPKKES